MDLYIKTEAGQAGSSGNLEKIASFKNGKSIYCNLGDATYQLNLDAGRAIYIFGELFYHRQNNDTITLIELDSVDYLEGLFATQPLEDIISSLEGQYLAILLDAGNDLIKVFGDRYGRVDSFYAQNEENDLFLATDLDFIFKHVKPIYDQRMIAHLLTVYGWYTPKGLTIYENVKQPKVGEIMTLTAEGCASDIIEFKPLEIEDYPDQALESYYRVLTESVVSRANRKGKTWVSSSSGWDSSILLGVLVNEFGSKNVGMLSGSMNYSEQTQGINAFETNKIRKIGDFYGIKPEMVEFDFASKAAVDYWDKVLPYYKSKHMYSFITYNFSKLSDGLREVADHGQVILNGETSDSFHNFGFSQFATFFHTKKSFTEYADKMNCYLFSPSFFRKVLDGSYEKDRVFQIFKSMMPSVEFSSEWNSREDLIQSFLFPLFYGGPRLPAAKTGDNPILTSKGQGAVFDFLFKQFMPRILTSLSPENLYSWYIFLYLSLHSQGSTVNVHKHSMEMNDHRWRMPFNDIRMIELLSKAPEKWGRGLEINNTKFPLKWVARNKIKFPYDILDVGPHSYLYDVIEGFSLGAEITYRSGVTEFFKKTLEKREYQKLLSDEYFDLKYIDKLVDDYLAGKEATGAEFSNLVAIITLSVVGWY